MAATCANCSNGFEISAEELAFLDKVSPVIADRKFLLPPPKLCPDCRLQRRIAFRNERHLYRRDCDLCGKKIVSSYHQDAAFPVYCPPCWWSDKWEAFSYGSSYDSSRSFFEQFEELKNRVPHLALHVTNNENSDYINQSGYNKDCYLIFAAEYNRECLYGTQVISSHQCFDATNCLQSEYCYEVVDVEKCYEVLFSKNCRHCTQGMFLLDCSSCDDCLFCVGLRKKQYHVFNEAVSKEEYRRILTDVREKVRRGALADYLANFENLKQEAVYKHLEIQKSETAFGDRLSNCKDVFNCFDLSHARDCRFVCTGHKVKDLMDVCHTTEAELGYEAHSIGYKSHSCLFAVCAWSSSNVMYVDNTHSCTNVFGCVGLRRGENCVLNVKYKKEDYDTLVTEILIQMQERGDYGEFFPYSVSGYAYNDSLANDYFPLKESQARALGCS